MLLGLNSLLSQQATENLTQERLKRQPEFVKVQPQWPWGIFKINIDNKPCFRYPMPVISDHKQSWRYEERAGDTCWWPLIFKKNFWPLFYWICRFWWLLDRFIIGSTLFASVGFGAGCLADVCQLTVTNRQKFFFISIHKPPASIRFVPWSMPSR